MKVMSTAIPLMLHRTSVSSMDNNCYLLTAGNEGLLIDAADDAPSLLRLAEEAGVRITTVVTTHRHWDHVRALPAVLSATGASHFASYLDAPGLPSPVDKELHDGDVVSFAGHDLQIRILRGHTPGGISLAADIDGHTHLFVGDSLFPDGLGKTNSDGDFVRLYRDVRSRLFDAYQDDAIVHPGHGPDTTLGAERPKLAEWWDRRW